MNTDAGGVAAAESLDSVTAAPPGGAWPVNMTIAVAVAPPGSVEGEIVSDFNAVSPIVRVPDADAPFNVAVIVAGVVDAT